MGGQMQTPARPDEGAKSTEKPKEGKKTPRRLLFIYKVPLRSVPREWQKPSDEKYQEVLNDQGFITVEMIKGAHSTELEGDCRELEQHLLPDFWAQDQLAHYYQNLHFRYQWLFIIATFLTTVLAAINVWLYAQGWQGYRLFGFMRWTEVLGIAAAALSGLAAAVSFLNANQRPQKHWFEARAKAENLRSLYFLFLARQSPFNYPDPGDRVQILRQKVLDVLRGQERPQTQTQGR